MLNPSPEQAAVCEAVATTTDNIVVEAAPGSGKTTTIAMAARTLPLGRLYVALAFAKANAEDFQRKLPMHVSASTCHSLCKRAIDTAMRGKAPKVTTDKVRFILKDNFDLPWEVAAATMKLVSLMKQLPDELELEEVADLATDFGIDVSDSRVVSTAVEALRISDEDISRIDFDDMLRVAALTSAITFPTFGIVFVDEAQDTNSIQRTLLTKFRSRVVAVGDPYQAIYGFRGASANALAAIRDDFDARVLPLSVSYRCSKAVVAEAQRVLDSPRFK